MLIEILPVDLTAKKTSNKKTEIVTPQNPIGKGYVLCPEWGAFYSDTLTVRDSNNIPLVKGTDYNVAYLYEELTLLSAKEVMGIILIAPNKTPPFKIDAQFVGGELFTSPKQIKNAIDDMLTKGKFKFSFWDILNRPNEYLPSKHQHELWQLLGMSSTVNVIDQINAALIERLDPNNSLIKAIGNYGTRKINSTNTTLDQVENVLGIHCNNNANPHVDNKTKLSLNNVNNWTLASNTESIDSSCDYRYQTAYGVYTKTNYTVDFTAHISQNNPHQTTITQLGGLTKADWNTKFAMYLGTTIADNTAYNSLKLQNYTLSQTYGMVGKSLNAANYTGQILEPRILGLNYNLSLSVLCADQQYRTISQMFNNYPVNKNQIISLGYYENKTTILTDLNSNYTNSIDGTVAIANIKDSYPFNYVGADLVTPLDLISAKIGNMVIYVKMNSIWTEI